MRNMPSAFWKNNGREKGFVLLAVMAFIALLLPLVILVLSSISTETISVGEAVKGSKAETAAQLAVANAISLIVQEKQLPNFWVSFTQPENAIIVDDGFGNRRNLIANNGAGADGVYGTEDDYWIGPRKDRSFLPGDDTSDPRNYDYDFRYLNNDGPVYLAQRWAFSLERHPFYFVPVPQAGPGFIPIQLYNQFAAVQSDADNDGMPEGFVPDALDRLVTPGYFPSAMPRNGPYNLDLTSPTIVQDMLSYRAQLYHGIPENLEEGPVPAEQTRAYASVTDENGRLNLNIFCKKMRVWLPESARYDTRYTDGKRTSDFNFNNVSGEWGWHWIDNPLFPDRDTVTYANGDPIDFGSLQYDPVLGLAYGSPTKDGIAMAELGETVQHLYSEGWEEHAVKSIAMLTALPGIDATLAKKILRALNPDLSAFVDQDVPTENGGLPSADNPRLDAPNLTPPLVTLEVVPGATPGSISDFSWHYEWVDIDDLPLPPPRPFNDIKELLNVLESPAKYERLKELVTVFSYDTNYIQNYISDVSATVDPVNPPDLPAGATRRPIPEYLIDRDTNPDVRYDISKYLEDTSLSALKEEADVLYNFIMNHLPRGTFNKFTLPVIDRAGRGPSDHLQAGPRPSAWQAAGYPYNVAERGHEFPLTDPVTNVIIEAGTGYPALDPPFSRDSALSILLYRHGMVQETAYHRYHPEPGREREPWPGIPVPGTRSFIPLFFFQPRFIPNIFTSQQYAVIPPHEFSSVADILEVPLYKFSRFSVDIMADPPSANLCAAKGIDEVTVRYYVTLSDVLKLGEYLDAGTPGDYTDDALAYTYEVVFDYNNDGVEDEIVPLVLNDNLRLVGPPPAPDRDAVITTFDQATGQRYLVFQHTFSIGDVPQKDKSRAGTANGDFAYDYFGNPFIVARVLGRRAVGTSDETRADAITKVYLQENCDIPPPLKVSIMAVRQSEDSFLLMSAVGGGVEDPNSLRIYNWEFDGSPTNVNGTYPPQKPPNDRDPRTAVVTLKSPTVRLSVYDMYAGGLPPGIGLSPPNTDIPSDEWQAMWQADGRLNPAFASNWDTLPESKDTDVVEVELVGTLPQVRAEVAVEPPAIERGSSAVIHVGAFGGTGPYDIAVQASGQTSGVVFSYYNDNYESNTLTLELGPFTIDDDYNVVVTVTDSTTPVPTVDVDSTTLTVGVPTGPSRRFINVPHMTASINLEELALPDKGFIASMSVTGGRGALGYLWQVFREDGTIAADVEGRQMVSNEDTPVFRFDPSSASDGVYIVKGMVIDQASQNPNNTTNTVLATDCAMVVVASRGSQLENEPMAVLSAIPPGNALSSLDTTPPPPPLIYGSGPAPILSTDAGIPAVSPEVAAPGTVIELRGYNFASNPEDNVVTFGGGATARGFEIFDDPSYAGPPPVRRVLRVVVPDTARSGWVYVVVNINGNGGVSNSAFFQTRFVVNFDVIASLSPQTSHHYIYEIDFQGDGIYDVTVDSSLVGGDNPRQIRHTRTSALQHDYSLDGFGNYQATLKVTDLDSGKVEISRQLIQIRNLRPLMDDPNNVAEAFGLITSALPSISERYPLPGGGLTVSTTTGGMSSLSGIRYKWNIDGNGRDALLRTSTASETYWETEPNDTPATADVMPYNYDPYTDGKDWTGRAVGPGDVDWFRVDTNPAGALTMLLQCFSISAGESITIELYDDGMNLIDSGVITSGQNHAIATTQKNAPSGSYYVRISATSPQTYELEATFSPNAGNTYWEIEPNNTSASAQTMPIDYDADRDGFPFTGQIPPSDANDEDWFRIATPVVGTLNVLMQSFDQTGGGREIYAELYDSGLNLLDSATISDGVVAEVVSSGFNSPIDTYFIRVWANDNNQRYSLDVSFVPTGSWGGAGPVNFNVRSSIHADARYANPGIPIKYFANLTFNFTTQDPSVFNITIDDSVPVICSWDVNGDGIMDAVIPASEVRTDLYTAQVLTFTSYTFNTIGSYSGLLYVTGAFRITDTANNSVSVPFSLPQPAPLPTVDISNVLTTLYLPSLSNNTDHIIAVTAVGEEFDASTGLSRFIYATDTLHIPSANNPLTNVFAFSALEPPYSLGNSPGSVRYTLIGIHGSASSLNFLGDVNTDGYFEIGQLEFPNPQPYSRVTTDNDYDRLNSEPSISFPTRLPGVFFTLYQARIPIEADKGIYSTYALVTDPGGGGMISSNPPSYAFETQEIFVGGSRSGGAGGLDLAVDIFINPLIGTTTQPINFEAYVAGGNMPYSYQWSIRHVATGTSIQFANAEQANIANPVFTAVVDALDEATAGGFSLEGDYEVQLIVRDAFGATVGSRVVTLTLKEAALSAQLLAYPPSATVDEAVSFLVYIDGGQPPYQVSIYYDDPNDASAGESVTTSNRFAFFRYAYDSAWLDRSTPPNGRYDDPEDGVDPYISVTDANGNRVVGIEGDPDFSINAVQKVLVGERLPLNITMAVAPTSGTSDFDIQVNYAVSGGRKFSGGSIGELGAFTQGGRRGAPQGGLAGDEYFVAISLIESGGASPSFPRGGGFSRFFAPAFGRLSSTVFRTESTTIIDPYGDDGIFMNGDAGEVYDPVYLHVPGPGNYMVVAFVTDGAGQWAIDQTVIYSEGYLSVPGGVSGAPQVRKDRDGRPLHAVRIWTDPLYTGSQFGDYDSNDYRLLEADIQIFGELLTVDPNPSIVSPAMFASKDPARAELYGINYLVDPETPSPVDFYDTFTFGRVNINTAPEDVLASVFMRITKERKYHWEDDPGGKWRRGDRDYAQEADPASGARITPAEARALARAVVEYRNAYYDAYKPSVSGGGFEYSHGLSANPYASGAVRVDHEPVIGPWDGVNPKVYDVTSRDDPPADYTSNVPNVWDNYRGAYYNLEPNIPNSASPLRFYAPSDIAVVRERLPGESEEQYAKYLNDVLDNSQEVADPMGIDNTAGFDARHYFTYDPAANESRADARNDIAIISSNGETAYTFIPNPPFQSIFDLYKVVGVSDPDLYELVDPEPRTFRVGDPDNDGRYDLLLDNNNFSENERTLSGPSLFRYVEKWDAQENRFIVIANYLDDIAPYITTRSYTYRIKGFGGVNISGYAETSPVTLDRIERDKGIVKIIDVGRMRVASEEGQGARREDERPYTVLYEEWGVRD